MITKLTLKNFKSIKEDVFEFTSFDLLAGKNNSGKSTALQALAIWQYCVDEFRRAKRKGKTGIQVVLPNFSALPVPEFNLLWHDRTDRRYPEKGGEKKQEYILIEIGVSWRFPDRDEQTFVIHLRYSSPQAIYAIPVDGWDSFERCKDLLPIVAYVPPFSGLEPEEEWRDTSVIRKQVGKAQPGSVLRNLLLQVADSETAAWEDVEEQVNQWFSVALLKPQYEKGVDTLIKCEYVQRRRPYDIIAGGSGFHQALTLLAFLHGYRPTTILLDEPDAHLHVNLQREILNYFKRTSVKQKTQFLIATHAEELVRGVDNTQIVFLTSDGHRRNQPTSALLNSMARVSNLLETQLREDPYLVYVEGESDERLLRAWAQVLGFGDTLKRFSFCPMGGGEKKQMNEVADDHFDAVRQLVPNAKRVVVLDYDTPGSYHPAPDNEVLFEWSAHSIENYLLVEPAWISASCNELGGDIFRDAVEEVVSRFFAEQSLSLPSGQDYRRPTAKVFRDVNAKMLLFGDLDSLRNKLNEQFNCSITPHSVAGNMKTEHIHDDIVRLFEKLKSMV